MQLDPLLISADRALRTLFSPARAQRPQPGPGAPSAATSSMSDQERRHAGALMRINHVGEVCAQALYIGQAATSRSPEIRRQLLAAADEETDHLAWTQQRLQALNARPSWLNPLWYSGAFVLGAVAGRMSPGIGLGFVAETERQVEAHLDGHLAQWPTSDPASQAVIEQMKVDEARHARDASQAGGMPLPGPLPGLMRAAAKLMTRVAYHV